MSKTLEEQIAEGNPPQWWIDMSPREKATFDEPQKRTEQDYLTILKERPDVSFSEYDNASLLFDMKDRGLIALRTDKLSIYTSMSISLYFELTDKGREVLETYNHGDI